MRKRHNGEETCRSTFVHVVFKNQHGVGDKLVQKRNCALNFHWGVELKVYTKITAPKGNVSDLRSVGISIYTYVECLAVKGCLHQTRSI